MKRFLKTKAGKLLGIVIVAGAIGGYLDVRFLQPKIHTATLSNVEAVVPQELLQPSHDDYEAEVRLSRLEGILNSYNPTQFGFAENPLSSVIDRLIIYDRLWNDGRLDNYLHVLDSGPIQLPSPQLWGRGSEIRDTNKYASDYLGKMKQFAKALASAGELYGRAGDRKSAMRCLLAVLKVDKTSWNLDGALLQYLVSISVDSIAMRAITNYAHQPVASPEDCARLLEAIDPAPVADDYLAQAWRVEFQREMLPRLPDPFLSMADNRNRSDLVSWDNGGSLDVGFRTSYEAIPTATALGRVFAVQIANAKRPLSEYNEAAWRLQRKAGIGLPKIGMYNASEFRIRAWDRLRFRIATYNTENYLGRIFITQEIGDKGIVETSCRYRTNRDAVRVLLASRLYRAAHGGELPPTARGLVPYLGAWPVDPYDGKPMRYNAGKQVVYAVGSDLVDDGGAIAARHGAPKDFGLSLVVKR